jgi:hypothetical protein
VNERKARRYQWGNQKPSIEKGQTKLCPKDTNGVIRSLQLKRIENTMTKRYQWCHQKPSIEKGQKIL